MYIGWASNVNKIIIDSTSVTVGDGATVSDSLETGSQKKRRVVSANPPDKYSVRMAFNFVEEDDNGLTELERFYSWYKHQHCYGVNPFEFPAILINSNRQKGASQEEIEHIIQRIINGDTTAKLPDNEYYVITSAVEGSKSGNELEVTMTWETYATGVYTIPTDTPAINNISPVNGYVDIILTESPLSEPTTSTWSLKINYLPTDVIACTYDGDVTVRYYFTPITVPGTYIITVGNSDPSSIVVE